MSNRRSIGIAYNSRISGTQELAVALVECLGLKEEPLLCSVLDLEQFGAGHPGVDLLITVGGDGTILRAAQIAAPHDIPLLGINMGRVGFLTELRADDAIEKVERYLGDDLWVEERTMLEVNVLRPHMNSHTGIATEDSRRIFHALNEVVVGSGSVARLVTVEIAIDGVAINAYRADAVIVATATGSTGYSLSAGGPILHPLSGDILLKSVAAHSGLERALVLPKASQIDLTPVSDGLATISVDGFLDLILEKGDRLVVKSSPYIARFLRAQPPSHYYAMLTKRLWLGNGAKL